MEAKANKTDVREKIKMIVYEAINELNQDLPVEKQLEQGLDTPLFGKSGKIDSLGLVRFIVSIEEKIEEILGHSIMLADEKAFAQKVSPFNTIGTLIDYIYLL
jgi:acyl carrier protein